MTTRPSYTPTLAHAQSNYALGRATTRRSLTGEQAIDVTPYSAEFDRLIAKVRADALREFAYQWGDGAEGFPYFPLLERADEIEDTK